MLRINVDSVAIANDVEEGLRSTLNDLLEHKTARLAEVTANFKQMEKDALYYAAKKSPYAKGAWEESTNEMNHMHVLQQEVRTLKVLVSKMSA